MLPSSLALETPTVQSKKPSTARHGSMRSICWCRIVCGHTVCSLGFKGKHLERVPCTNMHLYSLNFHPFPQNIPGLPECQVPGPASWNSPEKGGEAAGWGLWQWRGVPLSYCSGMCQGKQRATHPDCFAGNSSPNKRHDVAASLRERGSLQDSTLPMPTWQPRW